MSFCPSSPCRDLLPAGGEKEAKAPGGGGKHPFSPCMAGESHMACKLLNI
jgi:hypothetical protein